MDSETDQAHDSIYLDMQTQGARSQSMQSSQVNYRTGSNGRLQQALGAQPELLLSGNGSSHRRISNDYGSQISQSTHLRTNVDQIDEATADAENEEDDCELNLANSFRYKQKGAN